MQRILLALLMFLQLLHLTVTDGGGVNCTALDLPLAACGKFTANGCCSKGCVRNARDRCVPETCMGGNWTGWLSRPASMSCYFHWFLLLFAAAIFVLMMGVLVCNTVFEIRLCLRKRRRNRYVRFSPHHSAGSSVV
ncbi:CG15549 [Drosophila busckii]|uniref:CG15549 n=1 Tax=Drosophila busckii TaxID=30019 RepID=A0A0M4F4P8_DROBS|nr:uncharacterized protein LOC108602470 [Drosophila busckii]ALC46357.1 CG15549 [Drosophila busckii]